MPSPQTLAVIWVGIWSLTLGRLAVATEAPVRSECADVYITLLDPESRLAISAELNPDEYRVARHLVARARYVRSLLARGITEEDGRSLAKESEILEGVVEAHGKLDSELEARESLLFLQHFSSPEGLEEAVLARRRNENYSHPIIDVRQMLREPEGLASLRALSRALADKLRDYRREAAKLKMVFPAPHTRKAQKGYESLGGEQARDVADSVIRRFLEDPQRGETKTSFPNSLRFGGFNINGVSYRIAYEIKQDGSILFHALGPRENFYQEIRNLRDLK